VDGTDGTKIRSLSSNFLNFKDWRLLFKKECPHKESAIISQIE